MTRSLTKLALELLAPAIREGDVHGARELVRAFGLADAVLPGTEILRPLSLAATTGNIPMIDMLVDEKASLIPDEFAKDPRASVMALLSGKHEACRHLQRLEDSFRRAKWEARQPTSKPASKTPPSGRPASATLSP